MRKTADRSPITLGGLCLDDEIEGDHQPRVRRRGSVLASQSEKAGTRRSPMRLPRIRPLPLVSVGAAPVHRARTVRQPERMSVERRLLLRRPPNPVRRQLAEDELGSTGSAVVGRAATRVMAKSSTASSTPRSSIRPRLSLAMWIGNSSAEMTAAEARNWR